MGLFNLFNRSNKNSIKEKTYEENGYTIGVDSHIIYHVPKLQGSHVYAFPNGTTGLSKTAVMEMRDSALRQIIVPGSFKKFNVELELLNFEYLVLVELQEGVEEVHCIFDPNIDVILPTTIKKIGFYDYPKVQDLILPDGIVEITAWFASDDTNLISANIPGTIKEIPTGAFHQCQNLQKIVLNEGVETSGISAFYGTNNLRTLVLPSTYNGKIELPMISKENAKPTLFMKPEYIEDAGLIIRRGPGYDGKRFEEEQNEILNIKIKRGNKNFEFNMKRGEQPIIEIQQNLIEIRCINQPQVISIDCNQLEQGIYNIQNGTIEIQKSQSFQGQSEKGEIIMDKKKQKIIYEAILVHNAFNNELTGYSDNEYSRYHQQNADWYRGFSSRFNQILGFTCQTTEEFITYVSMADLTPEQKKP